MTRGGHPNGRVRPTAARTKGWKGICSSSALDHLEHDGFRHSGRFLGLRLTVPFHAFGEDQPVAVGQRSDGGEARSGQRSSRLAAVGRRVAPEQSGHASAARAVDNQAAAARTQHAERLARGTPADIGGWLCGISQDDEIERIRLGTARSTLGLRLTRSTRRRVRRGARPWPRVRASRQPRTLAPSVRLSAPAVQSAQDRRTR